MISRLLVQADKAFKVVKTSARTTALETKEDHFAYAPNSSFILNVVTGRN